jgi:hypothetical protein
MEKAAIKEVERHIKDIDTRYHTQLAASIHATVTLPLKERRKEIVWCNFPLYHSQAMSPGDCMARDWFDQ